MRYFRIVISDPKTGEIFVPNLNGVPGFSRTDFNAATSTYTSLNPGASPFTQFGTNPAAQCVELDIPVGLMHLPQANAYIKVWGISLAEIAQAANLNGMNIAVYGGMAKGLPLANPAQANLLVSGTIRPAFGNWINSDQTIEFTIAVGGASPSSNQFSGVPSTTSTTPVPATNETPANLTWQWTAGQSFNDAMVASLGVAYPKYKIQGATLPNLVWTSGQADTGFFASLQQFSQYINALSQKVIGAVIPDPSQYPGVSVTLQNNAIIFADGSTITTPKQIQFIDLIGQPTWGGFQSVQATCRLRGDINAGDYVKMPNVPGLSQTGQGITTSGSLSQQFNPQPGSLWATQKSGSIFTGVFRVGQVRHVGNSRDPNSTSWVTTLDMYLVSNQADVTSVPSLPVLYGGNPAYKFSLPQ